MQEFLFETYVDLCLNELVPQADYFGVIFDEVSYGKIKWNDTREKPSWEDVEAQWPVVKKELQRISYKESRTQLLEKAFVEVDEVRFNADETAQNRMLRAVWYMEEFDIPSVEWYSFDNVKLSVSLATMKQVLKLACENQSSVWFTPE